jgi:hypothetical protein
LPGDVENLLVLVMGNEVLARSEPDPLVDRNNILMPWRALFVLTSRYLTLPASRSFEPLNMEDENICFWGVWVEFQELRRSRRRSVPVFLETN